jgi:hypothetical protein
VIKEDLRNPNLLFVGTEFALFSSVDGGASWFRLMSGLPTVAVHDLVIHPRDNDLVAATHGRGLYILDDITPLQQLSSEVMAADAHLFEARNATRWLGISRGGNRGHLLFQGENPQGGAAINFYLREAQEEVVVEISDVSGNLRRTERLSGQVGINQYRWNLQFDPGVNQKEAFIESARQMLEQMAEQTEASRSQRRDAERIAEAMDPSQTVNELTMARQRMLQALGAGAGGGGGGGFGGRGGGRGGVGGLRGSQAEPGTYRVTLMVGGQSYVGTITLRADPILEAGK